MLAPPLHRRGDVEDLVRGEPRSRDDFAERRPASSERPGLVEDDRIYSSGKLERLAAADQNSRFGTVAGPDHDRRRSRQAHGARAGDDDDGDECHEGVRQARLRTGDKPQNEGGRADDEHDRHEDRRDPISQPLDRRLGPLCPADQIDDLRQGGISPDPRRPEQEGPMAVHRSADHLGADSLLGGNRLAGEHRLVDRGGAVHDAPVDGDPLTGSNAHEIADTHVLERYVDLGASPDDSSGPNLQPDQRLDRADGLALRPGLQPAARQDEPDDRGRAVEVSLRLDAR